MPTQIFDSFDLHKKSPLDARLESVTTVSNLPTLNSPSDWIPEGSEVYVGGTIKATYQAQLDPVNPAQLIWVKVIGNKTKGAVVIPASSNILDLSISTPNLTNDVEEIVINITGGNTVTINTIINLPSNIVLKLSTDVGNTITFAHVDYNVATPGQIVTEDGVDFIMSGRSVGNDNLVVELNSSIVTQVSNLKFTTSAQAAAAAASTSINVIDNLSSTSTTDALSANQGNILEMTKQVNLVNGINTVVNGNKIDVIGILWRKIVGFSTITAITGVSTSNIYHSKFTDENGALWILPAGVNPNYSIPLISTPGPNVAIVTGWQKITVGRMILRFSAVIEPLSTNTIASNYYIKWSSAPTFSMGNFTSNITAGGARLRLGAGTYSIKMHLNFNAPVTAELHTDGSSSGSSAAPLSASGILRSRSDNRTCEMEHLIEINSLTAFVLKLPNVTSPSLAMDFGSITITKLI